MLTGTILGCAGPEEELVNRFFTATQEKDLAEPEEIIAALADLK